MNELNKRKTPRHPFFDYNFAGIYFITICTQNKQQLLSRIVGTYKPNGISIIDEDNGLKIELTKYGKIADKYIKQLNDFYEHLSVEEYIIMPNHIHFLLCVKENIHENEQSMTRYPTNVERANSVCSKFVSTFKRFCNKEYGKNIWQSRFNDHVIRNSKDYDEHVKYIYENPVRWYYNELKTEE